MSETAKHKASYDELRVLPDNKVGEILGGELYASPRPAPRHARAYSALGFSLGDPFDRGRGGPGGWWIIDEPELHLADDVIVPDIAGWRRSRMPALPDTPWFELAPDWVSEILSPSTAHTNRAIKMPIYAREGLEHLWLVDPDARTLEVYALQESGRWLLLDTLKDDEGIQQPPFDAIEFPLADLWADPSDVSEDTPKDT